MAVHVYVQVYAWIRGGDVLITSCIEAYGPLLSI